MDLSLSDEQRLLVETVERFVADRYSGTDHSDLTKDEPFRREDWMSLAELGLMGLLRDEGMGGFGGGPIELALVAEALGGGPVPLPYWSSVVLAGALVDGQGMGAAMLAGELLVAPALLEPGARYDLGSVSTTVEDQRISGAKTVVPLAEEADCFVVSALEAGELGLYLVGRNAEGVSVRGYQTQDGVRTGEVVLEKALIESRVASGEEAHHRIETGADLARIALASEAVGCMAALSGLTEEYLSARKQFGRPLAGFQVLQHRMVEMRMAVEETRSIVLVAAREAAGSGRTEQARAVSAAKTKAGRNGRHVAEEAVQMHGGMGMTMEYPAGRYMRRLMMIETTLGDADYHAGRFSRLMAVPAA